MDYAKVQGVDKPLSRIVLGTMIISAKETERSFALLDAALQMGCSTFDTAHIYALGESERGIGMWFEARKNREDVCIVSKGAHPNADRDKVTPFDISADLHDSLARMKTDYVDIYLLHRDDLSQPVGPIVEVFNEHLRAGRIRAFGGSNWTHQRIQEANEYARANDLVPFTVSSPNYGLAEQLGDPWGGGCVTLTGEAQTEARKWYTQTRMPVLAWSSLGRGLFSGRIARENFAALKDTLEKPVVNAYCHERNFQRLDRARVLAQELGVSIAQVATAYAVSQDFCVHPIIGAADASELRQVVDALRLRLVAPQLAWLDLRAETRD